MIVKFEVLLPSQVCQSCPSLLVPSYTFYAFSDRNDVVWARSHVAAEHFDRPPLREMVIYEMHVHTFSEQGTFNGMDSSAMRRGMRLRFFLYKKYVNSCLVAVALPPIILSSMD